MEAGAKLKAKAMVKRLERRWYKPPIPSLLMGNVNALLNQVDELSALVKNDPIYRESWLTGCSCVLQRLIRGKLIACNHLRYTAQHGRADQQEKRGHVHLKCQLPPRSWITLV